MGTVVTRWVPLDNTCVRLIWGHQDYIRAISGLDGVN